MIPSSIMFSKIFLRTINIIGPTKSPIIPINLKTVYIDITVNIDPLSSSNADLMLDSTFESEEALKGYSSHPAHVAVANEKVRPFTSVRTCMDYVVE